MLQFRVILLVFVAVPIFVASSVVAGSTAESLLVEQDLLLQGESLDIEGDVLVRKPARLVLEGSQLRIHGALRVEEGAALELRPYAGVASRLSPLHDASVFIIEVQGVIQASGSPGAVVEGVFGEGAATVVHLDRGIVVNGTANLENVTLRDGSGALVVGEGGQATLRNVAIERLGFAGLAVYGNATLENVTTRGSGYGVIGKDACRIQVEDSTLGGTTGGVLVNACTMTVSDSVVEAARIGFTVNNAGSVEVRDSLVRNYSWAGVMGEGASSSGRPSILVDNVTFEPVLGVKPRHAMEASRAVFLRGGTSLNVNQARITGHVGHGVEVHDTQTVVANSTIAGNAGFGILAIGGTLGRQALATNDYGQPVDGSNNSLGPVSHHVRSTLRVVDQDGQPFDGAILTIRGARGEVVFQVDASNATAYDASVVDGSASAGGRFMVDFDAYGVGEDGGWVYRGPFRYALTHPLAVGLVEGGFDAEVALQVVRLTLEPEAGGREVGVVPGAGWWGTLMAVALGLTRLVGGRRDNT